MITVFVVEDHPVYRQGVAQLIEDTPDLVAGSICRSLEELDETLLAPGAVILLDLHLPGEHGAGAVARLASAGGRVLVLSASTEREDVVDAMGAGARGYLDKGADSAVILDAVRTVAEGRTYVSPSLASYLLNLLPEPHITGREREVLRLVAEGASDKAIARELGISINTVHAHLDRIREKTGARRRADLTRLALRKGLFPRQDG